MSLNSCHVVQLLWNIEPSHDRPSAHSILTPCSWDITIQIPFSYIVGQLQEQLYVDLPYPWCFEIPPPPILMEYQILCHKLI